MSRNALLTAVVVSTMLLAATPTIAAVVFVNKTGANVTDFHIEFSGTGGMLKPANSNPWGMGTVVTGADQNWAGAAIANNGTLTIPTWNVVNLPNKGGKGISTPNLTNLKIEAAYWTVDGKKVTGGLEFYGVPEPGAWAMMLIGFTAVGATIRARRREKLSTLAA